MLQISTIRNNPEEIITRLSIKNFDAKKIIDQIIDIDSKRRKTQTKLDQLLAHQNSLAKQVGELFRSGKQAEAKQQNDNLHEYEKQLHELMVTLPNAPSVAVPLGTSPDDNEVIFTTKIIPELPKDALPHWELASKYDLIDFELGVKITGAGFPIYKNKCARLQRALISWFLDKANEAGYMEVQPPLLINEASGFGTGQLPDKEGQMYFVGQDNLYVIPTAEVPVTNIYRDEIVSTSKLPIKVTAYTPCFRREAGSYGKDVRGLNRLHQFDKVEIVQIAHPDNSYNILEEMKDHVSGLLEELELPYRILKLCGGDLSFASALTYDMEVWSAAQKKWLEVSSVSNFETFQSNRIKLRYREHGEKPQLAHTLNGSALALPRILASLLENNQTADGIKIPKILVPYAGFEFIK